MLHEVLTRTPFERLQKVLDIHVETSYNVFMTTTTATTADQQASQADFVLLNLADKVVDAEKAVRVAANRIQDTILRTEQRLDEGRALNSLGELQALGAGLDCAVGKLEAAAAAFSTAWTYLGRGFPYAGNPEATRISLAEMLGHSIAQSDRLREITQ
jgi:hypothetical protein